MNGTRLAYPLLATAAVLLVSCGLFSHQAEHAPARDDAGLLHNPSIHVLFTAEDPIPDAGSFAWGMHYFSVKQDLGVDLDAVNQRLHASLEAELARHGFKPAEADTDLIVGYAVALGTDLDESVFNLAYGEEFNFTFPPAQTGEHRIYPQGCLIIDILDARSSRLVWRGTIRAGLDSQLSESAKDLRARQAVKLLLDQFPRPKRTDN